MAAKTISQRISLEGSEDIRKKLEQLGKSGEQAFKQIQDAAKKPITDPAQIDKTKQAIDQLVQAGSKLGQQFQALTNSTRQFGAEGEKAAAQVTAGLNQTSAAAQQTGTALQQTAQAAAGAGQNVGTGLISSANAFRIAALGIVAAITAVTSALTKGAVETGTKISEQAEKINATIPQWLALRKAIGETTISQEDFLKAAEKASGVIDRAKGGTAQLAGGMTETATATKDGAIVLQRFNDRTTDISSSASKAATELAKLSISTRAAAMPDLRTAMRQLADEIFRIPDATKQAAAGTAVFGKNWKEMVEILRTGQRNIDNTARSLAEADKAGRDMSTEQVEAAKKLGESWKDLGEAIRATRDLIGTLFVGGAQTRADWLIKLVDGSRELFRTWAALAEQKRAAFVEGLGETPTEILFKTLLAIGQQLAGLWRDVLVPAGRALVNIFKQISGQFEGVSKSQVAAFFITATAAAIGLSLAFKALGLVLTPLLLLFTPFGAILLAAGAAALRFWGVLAAGAQRVAALIPNSLALISTAIRNLFAGNFAKAWTQFAEGATAAFGTVAQAAVRAQGPIGSISRAIQRIATDFPGAIKLMVTVLIGLGVAATGVADVINKIFGTQLTGTDIALIAIVLQLTGALSALASVAVIVGTAFGILATIFGGPIAAAIVGLIALIAYVIVNFDRFKADALATWEQIATAGVAAVDLLKAAWDGFVGAITAAMDAINGAINAVIGTISSLITAIGNAISALANLLTKGAEVGAPGLSDTGGFAGGGRVGGRGSGTSDSNLAWVSRGEHIMPARAVRQPGVLAFLEALRRSGGNLSRVLDGMGRFAMGGLALPAFAEGGLNGMSNVTIQFPGLQPIGGLRAPADVVEELRKAAAMAQVRSGGRKPSRYS